MTRLSSPPTDPKRKLLKGKENVFMCSDEAIYNKRSSLASSENRLSKIPYISNLKISTNENTQTLSFDTVNNNNALFSVQPA